MTIDQALRQAIAHHQAGQLKDAERLYCAILQAQPNHPDANHNLGVLAVQVKQPDTGLSYFKAALEASPNQGQYWLSYIDALIQTGQSNAARQVLAQGRQRGLNGDVVEAMARRLGHLENATPDQSAELEYAIAHREAGHYKKAVLVLQNWLVSNPQDASAYALLAQVLSLDKQDEPAWLALTMALSINPTLPMVQRNHARLLLKQQKPDEALQAAQAAYHSDVTDPENQLVLAAALGANSQNEQAFQLVTNALQSHPNYAEAYANRALLKLRGNDYAGALADAEKSLSIKPHWVQLWGMAGSLRYKLKNLPGAIEALEKAIKLESDNVGYMVDLGELLRQAGKMDAAIALLEKAVSIAPDNAGAWVNLGTALQESRRIPEAKAAYAKALEIAPEQAEVACNLGVLAKEEGNWEEALRCFNLTLEISPDLAEAHNSLGALLKDMGRLEEAEASYRRALQIKPDFAEALSNLGTALKRQGLLYDAKACYRKAHQLGFYRARILEALMLPAIMGTRQEMLESRAEYESNLDELIVESVTIDNPLQIAGETSFYLAYHGLNDRNLQVKLAKYYEQVCPSLLYTAQHCAKLKLIPQKKIQIGFFSEFLYTHSVSLCYSNVVKTVSLRDDFEVALISSRPIDGKLYSEFAGKRVRVPHNLVTAREMLAELKLDILVYLDIGMELLSYFLAFSRLAPVQCVLSGHPVTTGITNMDYYLSDELLEPHGADEHYSEKLIRLPRSLFYFERPMLPTTLKTRHELGLPEGRHIYMCPMRLQKMHPDFDEAITRILLMDGNGIVVLFEDIVLPFGKKILVKRFKKTIPAEVQERIIFLPWLKEPADFISAIATADVILDPFHFGIGSTVIMIFATNTPLVTKAGEFMRGRVGAGYCEMLDLTECIAEDTESYAQKAVEIAGDQLLREKISAKIRRNSPVLYENLQPVEDLVNFFYSLTDNRHTA